MLLLTGCQIQPSSSNEDKINHFYTYEAKAKQEEKLAKRDLHLYHKAKQKADAYKASAVKHKKHAKQWHSKSQQAARSSLEP
jgi:glycerol-3-phosphate dehydrogenase